MEHGAVSKAQRRYIRTIILAVAAMGTLIWAAIDLFEIPPQEMLSLLISVAIGAGGIIVVAGLGFTLWMGLRKLLQGFRH